MFCKKGVFVNFAKFTGGLRPATLLKKRHWHRCFPVNFAKFPRTPFLQNTSGRLLFSSAYRYKITFYISASKFGCGSAHDKNDFDFDKEIQEISSIVDDVHHPA